MLNRSHFLERCLGKKTATAWISKVISEDLCYSKVKALELQTSLYLLLKLCSTKHLKTVLAHAQISNASFSTYLTPGR